MKNLLFIDFLICQVGCVAMWNLCLPLLQKDFRKAIKAPLSLVAVALEDIDRFVSYLLICVFVVICAILISRCFHEYQIVNSYGLISNVKVCLPII